MGDMAVGRKTLSTNKFYFNPELTFGYRAMITGQGQKYEFKGSNKVESITVNKMKLGDPDESGRRKPVVEDNSEFEIKADMVIKALGFDPEELPKLFDEEKLQVTKWGTVKTNFDTMETNIPGVFAAGDIIRGASLVVWAIKDGRDAAKNIEIYLELKQKKKVA